MSLTDHQKNQLLDAVAHYMGPELRGKIMSELPLAYNAWVGRQIMSVEKLSDAEAEVRAQEANALDEEMFKPHVNVMGCPGETKAQEQRIANEAIMDEDAEQWRKRETAVNAQKFVEHARQALSFEHKRANPTDVCKHCGYNADEHDEMGRCPDDDDQAHLNRADYE